MTNLLFISIEDLNDWIEPLGGHPQAFTPNLARLARMGAVFKNAYATAPACSPSRTATLFSRFPWESGVYLNKQSWFHAFPHGQGRSLFGKLRQAGFSTYGAGKIFHVIFTIPRSVARLDLSDWTEYFAAPMAYGQAQSRTVGSGDLGAMSDFGVDASGKPSFDDLNADWMVKTIKPGATNTVWAHGIYRPHLPFVVPQKYFDMIDEHVSMPPGLGQAEFDPDNSKVLKGLPRAGKLMSRKTSKTGKFLHKHGEYTQFLRAYLASIAYADSKLGLILDRLEECGLMETTNIILWSDHGWQLGEKLAFRKFTLWERALRVPVMIAGPGIAAQEIDHPISLADLAPTALSLLGAPANPAFSGQDLTPVLAGAAPKRPYAPSVWVVGNKGKLQQAWSVRTRKHRYIQYWNGDKELYDHSVDPHEHNNLMSGGFFARASARAICRQIAPFVAEIAAKAKPVDHLGRGTDDGDDDE